jgi:hypothetical protein
MGGTQPAGKEEEKIATCRYIFGREMEDKEYFSLGREIRGHHSMGREI